MLGAENGHPPTPSPPKSKDREKEQAKVDKQSQKFWEKDAKKRLRRARMHEKDMIDVRVRQQARGAEAAEGEPSTPQGCPRPSSPRTSSLPSLPRQAELDRRRSVADKATKAEVVRQIGAEVTALGTQVADPGLEHHGCQVHARMLSAAHTFA